MQSKPNGLPTATAIWPTRSADESPNATGVRSGACSADDREVGVGIVADQVAGQLAPVEQRDRDALGAADDVAVGQHEAVGREHEARPAADRFVGAARAARTRRALAFTPSTSMRTTDGLTAAATAVTVRE